MKIAKKHETPTRAGGVMGAGVGLATGLVVALFPFAAIGGGLVAATTGGGAILGAVAGHAAAGMSRHDLKELGEQLDAGQAGLVVVGVADMGAKIEAAMKTARVGPLCVVCVPGPGLVDVPHLRPVLTGGSRPPAWRPGRSRSTGRRRSRRRA